MEFSPSVAKEKAATNNKGTEGKPQCLHCGWGNVPDLSQRIVGGNVLYECVNPFKCFQRGQDLDEFLDR